MVNRQQYKRSGESRNAGKNFCQSAQLRQRVSRRERGREMTIEENKEILQHDEEIDDLLNLRFTRTEVN